MLVVRGTGDSRSAGVFRRAAAAAAEAAGVGVGTVPLESPSALIFVILVLPVAAVDAGLLLPGSPLLAVAALGLKGMVRKMNQPCTLISCIDRQEAHAIGARRRSSLP